MFQAAAIQMSAGPVRAENEKKALSLLDRACETGARLLGLPEMWEHVGPAAQKREFAGTLEGPQLARVRELCARRSVWCLAGSIAERAEDGRVHNTAVLIDPQGGIAASYRKLHLFDVDIPDGARYRESEAIAPGQSAPPVVELSGLGVKLGLSVCYDLRFPELYRRMGELALIIVPSAFTATTGAAH
ncbi:MAG TPA: nitrilase-related carbon-nitrogen hydrolase, partial [Myxococcales bacterium]|nr:nitrilase-related carbon-nitrogen hydrolase [Myxococcales bacterium]